MSILLFLGGILGFVISLIILIIKAIRKKRKFVTVIALIFFLAMFIYSLTLPSEGKVDAQTPSASQPSTTEPVKQEQVTSILDDEYITAEFLGFEDFPDLGFFSVTLRVTNKTDQKIWVYLDEASVNDEMMSLITSGTPLYILPEKKGTNAFAFNFKQISIDSFDEVEKVSFKIGVKNEETLADIDLSSEITITK